MRLWRITDDEYIVRVRSFHRKRRLFGCVIFVVGLCFTVSIMWFANNLIRQSREILNSISRVDSPTTEDIACMVDESKYLIGFSLGTTLGGGCFIGLSAVGTGLGMILNRDRKTQMLLECIDRQTDVDV